MRQFETAIRMLVTMSNTMAKNNIYNHKNSKQYSKDIVDKLQGNLDFMELITTSTYDELYHLGFRRWDENLILIPLWIFPFIKDGVKLYCFDGEIVEKGKDEIDTDTRFGCMAYGVHEMSINSWRRNK